MSTWRQKAIACLPAQKSDFEQAVSVHEVFFALLPSTQTSHEQGDEEQLRKNYAFAEWCFRQHNRDLWNAAAVSFYEHLGDHESTRRQFPRYVPRDIYLQVKPLLAERLSAAQLLETDKAYSLTH